MKRSKRLSWCLGITLGLAILGCAHRREPTPERALELIQSRLELGTLTQNEPLRGKVELRNRGKETVRLRTRSSTARCRWEALPAAIAPGTNSALWVTCQSDLLGALKEELSLLDATRGDTLATLQIVGQVEPIIGFDTTFVDLRPDFGQTSAEQVHLVGKRAAQATPRVTSTGGDMLTVTALAAAAGRAQGFRVTCKGDRVGMHAGSLVVQTGIAEQPTLTLSWGCRVPATLEVEPSNPYFNLRVSGDRATTITVKSSQPSFVVKSARVVDGPFVATLERADSQGRFPITIRVKNGEIPEDARAATGTLVIESNDLREPRKEVPLFGFGKVNKVERPDSN